MWELVIVWNDGSKDVYSYNDRAIATEKMEGFRKAFGSQVWCCVREGRR